MKHEDKECSQCFHKLCMHKVPVFSSLSKEDLAKVADLVVHKNYKKKEILFQENQPMDSIVIINAGSAKAYKYTPDGREQILYIFAEGDFFGEQNLFGNHVGTYTIEALENTMTCFLTKLQFQKLIHQYPDIGIKIIEELGERMGRLENTLQSMGVRNVDARISSLLLEFADKFGTQVPEGILINLPLSREGMANYLGIARETVSRKLGQLENEDILRTVSNKSILILKKDFLEETSGIYE